MPQLFFFSRYQTKCAIKFLFRKLMTSETRIFIFDLSSSSKAMTDREKKGEKTEIQKLEYLKNAKSFLDEINN